MASHLKDIDSKKRGAFEVVEALLDDIPFGTIQAECVTGMLVDVNQRSVFYSRIFKTEGLPTSASAEFYRCQSAFLGLRPISLCPRFREPGVFSPSSRFLWEKTSRGRETPLHLLSPHDGFDYLTSGTLDPLKKIYL